jgi:plasmid rolling circle replication initiator protein Rep
LAQETGFEADTELSDNESKARKNYIDPVPTTVDQDMETENVAPQKPPTITTSTTSSLVISPKISNTVVKRPKKIDISKFNKSNRKSKNCAIFYFKHMDTDTENNNENNGITGSEV